MFVDIHNHILPGVDDGAATLADAIGMARMAVAGETDIMVATPHRSWMFRRDAPRHWLLANVAQLQVALEREKIPLTILPGVEIKLGHKTAQELTSGILTTLGDSGRYALVETPSFDKVPHDAVQNVAAIIETGIKVVLAHPERNADIQRSLAFVEACADMGVTFQINSGSILGLFGKQAKKTAEAIIKRDAQWPIIFASDSHDQAMRSPGLLRAAREAAAQIIGPERAQLMVDARPREVIRKAID